jgi:hypothetical protein
MEFEHHNLPLNCCHSKQTNYQRKHRQKYQLNSMCTRNCQTMYHQLIRVARRSATDQHGIMSLPAIARVGVSNALDFEKTGAAVSCRANAAVVGSDERREVARLTITTSMNGRDWFAVMDCFPSQGTKPSDKHRERYVRVNGRLIPPISIASRCERVSKATSVCSRCCLIIHAP